MLTFDLEIKLHFFIVTKYYRLYCLYLDIVFSYLMPSITLQFSDNEANLIKQIAALNGTQHTSMMKDIVLSNVLDPIKESLLKHIAELESFLILARRIQHNEPLLWKDTERFISYMNSHGLNVDTDHKEVANLCQNLQNRVDFLKNSLREEEAIKAEIEARDTEAFEEDFKFTF